MTEIIIDASNKILGRMATFAAKQAMLGNKIVVVNSEKVVISGNKRVVIESYLREKARGAPMKGPYFPRKPEMIVRRTIRGMIPYHQAKGKDAFARVTCYKGIPERVSAGSTVYAKIPQADAQRLECSYITLERVCQEFSVKN